MASQHPRTVRWLGVLAAGAVALGGGSAALADGHGGGGGDGTYTQLNLISDIPGVARITDPNLVNPWGMAAGPNTPLWVSDNGPGVSTLYTGGVRGSIPAALSLVVTIPDGAPTGVVFNPTDGFKISNNGATAPARFIFDSEAGQITAWSPNVPPTDTAQVVPIGSKDAVYKGITMLGSEHQARLYAADFHNNHIDVFDDQFHAVTSPGAFTDPNLPSGFAPFDVQALGGMVYVAYAQQDADAHDDVAGPGLGFVDVYDGAGHLLKRLISGGALNAPWGMVLAPKGFGRFGGDLLVGNFGDGMINAYNPQTGHWDGALTNGDGNPITINGLWALRFGNGVTGTPNTLLFTAGIADESHGLFGEIVPGGGHH